MAQGTKHVTRTTDRLNAEGFVTGIVERRIPFPPPHGKTIDFIGLIDVIAFDASLTRGIQVCGQDFAAHITKMLGNSPGEDEIKGNERRIMMARAWLAAPHRTLELWGWRKLVKRNQDGSKAKVKRWEPRVKVFTSADYI